MEFIVMMTEDGHRISFNKAFGDELLIDGNAPAFTTCGSDYKVIGVYVVNHLIIVFTDHSYFHRASPINPSEKLHDGNVFAVATNGDILWKIEDLISDFSFPFHTGHLVTENNYEFESIVFNTSLDSQHKYFIFDNICDAHYLVDITEGKLISMATYKN